MGLLFHVVDCPGCKKRFRLNYNLEAARINPQTVIEQTCPNCWNRFRAKGEELRAYGAGGESFPLGRQLRRVLLRYDCPGCKMHGIHVLGMFTDYSKEELQNYPQSNIQCSNPNCSLNGRTQELRPAQVEMFET